MKKGHLASRRRRARRRSAQFITTSGKLPHKSKSRSQRKSAEFRKIKKPPKTRKNPFDRVSGNRGRRPKFDAATAIIASDLHKQRLEGWKKLIGWKVLLRAKSVDDLEAAFAEVKSNYVQVL